MDRAYTPRVLRAAFALLCAAGCADPPAPPPLPTPGALVINEIACDGADERVEVLNVGGAPLSLHGIVATDDVARLDHAARFAPATLAPGAFAVAQLSGFGLACGAEDAVVRDAGGRVLAAARAELPRLAGKSWGRIPDGTGPFTTTERTPGAPNAVAVDPSDALFGLDAPLLHVELALTPDAEAALNADPSTYVQATAVVNSGQGPSAATPIGLRLKGRYGSFRDLGGKAAFKLDLDRFDASFSLAGKTKLALNNQVQDPSRIHEWIAYALFRSQGVPCPRTGWAQVSVNGVDYGTYLLVEGFDQAFLREHFASTQALYEGAYGQDLFEGSAFDLDNDAGDPSERAALETLIAAVANVDRTRSYAALDPLLDWDEILAAMATEIFIGHWDGYAPTRNNYFLHVDAAGVWSLLPWGTDQTFDSAWPLYDGAGLLFSLCTSDRECLRALDRAYASVSSAAGALVASGLIDDVAATAERLAATDPRAEHPASDVVPGAQAARAFLSDRVRTIHDELTCHQDSTRDADADGSACALDCDDGDPTRHRGAVDACGNQLDEDCNGRVDDGPGCPDCAVLDVLGAPVAFCGTPRPFAAARARCVELGGDLLHITSAVQNNALTDLQNAQLGTDAWIGLSDAQNEGDFVWTDGQPATFTAWNDGEPNDFGAGEDCTEGVTSGGWNDLTCGVALPALCQLPLP